MTKLKQNVTSPMPVSDSCYKILWNHSTSLGPIFMDCVVFVFVFWFFAESWGLNFMEVSVFSVSKKTNSFKTCFCGRCEFVGKGYPRKLSHHKFK